MSSPQLPSTASKSNSYPPGMVLALVAWLAIATAAVVLVCSGGQALLRGDVLSFVFDAAMVALLGWSTGGFLINVPLCMYLTTKFSGGHLTEIAATYRRALHIWERLPVAKDVNLGVGMATFAFIQHTRGRFDEAESHYRKALKLIEKNKQAAYPHLAAITNNYASLLLREHRFVEAEDLLDTSIAIWEKQKGAEWNGSAIPLCTTAAMHLECGELDKAEDCLLNARRRFEAQQNPRMILPDSMWQCKTVCYLGLMLVYCRKKQWGDAFKFMELSLDLVHHRPISFGPLCLYVTNKIVEELLAAGKLEQAERMIELAYMIGGKYPDHPDAIAVLEQYDNLLRLTGRTEEIGDMRRWIRPVTPKIKLLPGSN
ncbi:MAG: tetratricopeptide repeat protein [Candidatus Obscuribacterales bacterium]|nr:tetratricopeptide repeat protein [Candidatus Obscuribacterales bacterium]